MGDWRHITNEVKDLKDSPDVALLSVGGFVYFDGDFKVVHILSALSSAGRANENLPYSHDKGAKHGALHFGEMQQLSDAQVSALRSSGALHPVSLREFVHKGAEEFGWIPAYIEGDDQNLL